MASWPCWGSSTTVYLGKHDGELPNHTLELTNINDSYEIYLILLILVCIENMFIVTNAIVSTSVDLPVSERMGRGKATRQRTIL
jgi:hypothetical protein